MTIKTLCTVKIYDQNIHSILSKCTVALKKVNPAAADEMIDRFNKANSYIKKCDIIEEYCYLV